MYIYTYVYIHIYYTYTLNKYIYICIICTYHIICILRCDSHFLIQGCPEPLRATASYPAAASSFYTDTINSGAGCVPLQMALLCDPFQMALWCFVRIPLGRLRGSPPCRRRATCRKCTGGCSTWSKGHTNPILLGNVLGVVTLDDIVPKSFVV